MTFATVINSPYHDLGLYAFTVSTPFFVLHKRPFSNPAYAENSTMSTPHHFRNLAILAVRLLALALLLLAARSAIYAMLWNGAAAGVGVRVDAVIQGGGSIALSLLSAPLGRLVSARLDDVRA